MGMFLAPINVAVETAALGIYAPSNLFVIANQDVTNSTTFTDSTNLQVSLIAGATYDFQTMELIGASSFATSGAKSVLAYTGTATFYGQRRRNGASNVEPINISATWGGSGEAVNGTAVESTKSLIVERFGRIVTTTAGTLKIQFAQNTAISGHYARLLVGSFLKVQRVS